MTKPHEKLAFAARFAYLDLDAFDEDGRRGLGVEITKFLGEGEQEIVGGRSFLAVPLDLKSLRRGDFEAIDLRGLQTEVKAHLERLAPGGGEEGGVRITRDGKSTAISVRSSITRFSGGVLFQVVGTTRNVFLYVLINLLSTLISADELSRLVRCANPDCPGKRLFYKYGRKRFCSTTCANYVNYHAWLGRQAEKIAPKKRVKK